MLKFKLSVLLAALFVVGISTLPAIAGDNTSETQYSDFSLQPQYAAQTTAQRTPLMALLDQAGAAQSLDAARINVYGYIEGGYTINSIGRLVNDSNADRAFDNKNDRAVINQVSLSVERTVDLTQKQFDIGFHVEMLYGTDPRIIHANGFLEGQGRNEYQYDIPNLYVDFAIPLGTGIRLRAGRFEFFKSTDPNVNPFYSHTIAYTEAFPFTNTGITAAYDFTDTLNVEAGISRGFDQASKDNNGAIDFLAKVTYSITPKTLLTAVCSVGPELNHNNGDYLAGTDIALTQVFSRTLSLIVDANFSHIFGSGVGEFTGPLGTAGSRLPESFYGASGSLVYRLDEHFSFAGRLEWYRDEEGLTLGTGDTLYAATVGATITPFPEDSLASNLKIRPEIRTDYAIDRYFDNGQKYSQATFGIDAIFNY